MSDHEMAGKQDLEAISAVLQAYFNGLYEGDVDKIRAVFHEDTVLKAPGVRRGRDEYVGLATSRPVQASAVTSPEIIAGERSLQSRRGRYELRTAQ